MTHQQVALTEKAARKMVSSCQRVFTQNTSLVEAKSIRGLRAVFGEVYPDPVRVVSIGVPINRLIAESEKVIAAKTSVEFCGGTQVVFFV